MVCRRLVPMMLLLRMRMTADGGGCDESDDDVGVDGVCVDVEFGGGVCGAELLVLVVLVLVVLVLSCWCWWCWR